MRRRAQLELVARQGHIRRLTPRPRRRGELVEWAFVAGCVAAAVVLLLAAWGGVP